MELPVGPIIALLIVLAVVITVARTIRIVPQARAGIVERLGRYHRTLNPGLAIVIPFLTIVAERDVNMLALAVVAAGAPAIMQYFLTGGPVAALATTIPVVPGSELKAANRFQRPSQLFGLLVLAIIGVLLGGF